MAKRRLGSIILLICFCLCLLPLQAKAISTAEAKGPVATQNDCHLTISYRYGDTAFAGQTVKLYKVAEVSADSQYTLTPSFGSSGLILNGIQSNSEWDVVRSTLEAFILANDVEPVLTAVTDKAGNASAESLKTGLYLASAVDVAQGELTCCFDSVLIALPGLGTDGNWIYQVAVAAKPEILPPIAPDEKIELKVLKLWKGDQGSKDRPDQIEVTIYRNGRKYETVVLSEENHWAYTWSAKTAGDDWAVAERKVPAGYTMTVTQRGNTFVVTNTRTPETPEKPTPRPPFTGDTSNIMRYTVAMCVSGMMLIILGIAGKRKRHEETN